jgi:hypothetical protein
MEFSLKTRTDELLVQLLADSVGRPTGLFLRALHDDGEIDRLISRVTPQSGVEALAWHLISRFELLGGGPSSALQVDFDFLAEHVIHQKRQADGLA